MEKVLLFLIIPGFFPQLLCTELQEDGLCIPKQVERGSYTGDGNANYWTGQYRCDPGYKLVGASLLKCNMGQWSSKPPVCTAIGMCDPSQLPRVKNARLSSLKEFRNSVFKYSCIRGFTRFGPGKIHCDGEGWNVQRPPVCTKPGCDEEMVTSILYGKTKRLLHGTVYRFQCEPETSLLGPDMVYCDGVEWSELPPICLKAASEPLLSLMSDSSSVEVTGLQAATQSVQVMAGVEVIIGCKETGGNPPPNIAISFDREDMQGSWSNRTEAGLAFTPEAGHNGLEVTCRAWNTAMEAPASTTVQLEVQSPASHPHLTMTPSLPLTAGSEVAVTCRGQGGNPKPSLRLSLSSTVVTIVQPEKLRIPVQSVHYIESDDVILAEFVVQPEHNGAVIICEANNSLNDVPATASKQMQVLFPAQPPTLSTFPSLSTPHPSGTEISVICESSYGNPRPKVLLILNSVTGVKLPLDVSEQDDDVLVARFTLEPQYNGAVISCEAWNELNEAAEIKSQKMEVLFAAQAPSLSTSPSLSSPRPAGSEISVTCASSSGNPKPNLQLILTSASGDELPVKVISTDDDIIAAKLTLEPHHNGAVIQCQAWNEQNEAPESALQEMEVQYPAESPNISTTPSLSTLHPSGSEISVTCGPSSGNPKPDLRLTITLASGDELPAEVFPQINDVITANLTLEPQLNGAVLSCAAWNYLNEAPSMATMDVAVEYYPESLTISGSDHVVYSEQGADFRCESSPGNPPITLAWTGFSSVRGHISQDIQVFDSQLDPSFSSGLVQGWISFSSAFLPALQGAENVEISCVGKDRQGRTVVQANKTIYNHFPPEQVVIEGPDSIASGEDLTLECIGGPSVPRATISWEIAQDGETTRLDGETVEGGDDDRDDEPGHLVESRITWSPGPRTEIVEVTCHASNPITKEMEHIAAHITVHIFRPPGQPEIHGYTQDQDRAVMVAGNPVRLTCSAEAGNPPGEISWARGDTSATPPTAVEQQTAEQGAGMLMSAVEFVAGEADGQYVTCQTYNSVSGEPLRHTIWIDVVHTVLAGDVAAAQEAVYPDENFPVYGDDPTTNLDIALNSDTAEDKVIQPVESEIHENNVGHDSGIDRDTLPDEYYSYGDMISIEETVIQSANSPSETKMGQLEEETWIEAHEEENIISHDEGAIMEELNTHELAEGETGDVLIELNKLAASEETPVLEENHQLKVLNKEIDENEALKYKIINDIYPDAGPNDELYTMYNYTEYDNHEGNTSGLEYGYMYEDESLPTNEGTVYDEDVMQNESSPHSESRQPGSNGNSEEYAYVQDNPEISLKIESKQIKKIKSQQLSQSRSVPVSPCLSVTILCIVTSALLKMQN